MSDDHTPYLQRMEEYMEPPNSPVIVPLHPLPPIVSPVHIQPGDMVITIHQPLFFGDDGDTTEDDRTLGSEDTYSVPTDPDREDEYDFEDPFIDDSEIFQNRIED